MGSRVLRLVAGPALAAFLLVGAATPALADATNANAAQAQADGSNGKAADNANANEKAGANEKAANNPHAAEPKAPAGGTAAPSDNAAPSSTTTSPSKTSSKPATTTKASGGCSQTPYGSGGSGANTGGAYDDTCEPKASGNGNGGGVAKGKPAAGTVGKADEKNPPGQVKNSHDNGYECSGNKGIARTNPAHTGCRTTPPPCVPTEQDPCEEPNCVPTAEDDCLPDCVPTAEDDCEPDCVPTIEDPCEPPCVPTEEDPCTTPVCVESATVTCTEVEGKVITRGGTKVLGAVFTRGGLLASTGASVLDLTLVGSVLVAAGFVLARLSRRGSFET